MIVAALIALAVFMAGCGRGGGIGLGGRCRLGGRERTLEDFAVLVGAVGLKITSVTPAEWGISLIDCTVL